jgi:WD40 repeat protein
MGRYAYGWTWVGTCLMRQSLLPSSICTCNTNLQPADGSSFNLHLSCSFSGNSTVMTQTCLGTYNYTRVSTYETPVRADRIQSLSFAIDSEDRKANRASVPVTLGFTAANPIPSGGTLTLNYPSGFFATSVIPFIEPGASSLGEFMAWCGETTASSLIITTHGAAISAPAFTVTIQGFTMGSATAGADISLQSSSDINASAPVASGQIFGQVLNVTFDISWYDRIAGKPSVPVTLGFTPSSPIPSGGTITLTYPHLFFDLLSQPLAVIGPNYSTNLTLTLSAVTASFMVIFVSGATISASPFSLVIRGMCIGAEAASSQGVTVRTSIDRLSSASISSGFIWSPGNMLVSWSPQNTQYSRDSAMEASVKIWGVDRLQSAMTSTVFFGRYSYKYTYSQNYAVDVSIRNVTSDVPIVLNYFRFFLRFETQWDAGSGPFVHLDRFYVAWSPDNSMIATFLDTNLFYVAQGALYSIISDSSENSDMLDIRVWDISSRSVMCRIPMSVKEKGLSSIWSPDGLKILSGTTVYNSRDGSKMMTLSGSTFTSVLWSRDSTKLLSGHYEGIARLHDTKNGSLLMTFSGNASAILALAWSPDETKFATGSADSIVRVWSIERNACLFIGMGHKASISEVWWQDDVTIIAGASDNSQRAWLLPRN